MKQSTELTEKIYIYGRKSSICAQTLGRRLGSGGEGGCFQIFLLGFGHRKTNILLLNWNFSWLPSPSHLKVRPRSKSFTLSSLGHVSFAVVFTARKRSLGQGNMFTGVCLSTGGVLSQYALQQVSSGGGGVSRPTPKGKVEGDLVQAHSQGGS